MKFSRQELSSRVFVGAATFLFLYSQTGLAEGIAAGFMAFATIFLGGHLGAVVSTFTAIMIFQLGFSFTVSNAVIAGAGFGILYLVTGSVLSWSLPENNENPNN